MSREFPWTGILILAVIAAVYYYQAALTEWIKRILPSTDAVAATKGEVSYSTSKPISPEYLTIPIAKSEPDVSEGELPTGFSGKIPLCPSMVAVPRYAGDDQLCCQCPGGWLHCGSASNMKTQMSGQSGASWQAICNL